MPDTQSTTLHDFFTFLKFQSISSEPGHKQDIHACVNWLKNRLDGMGLDTELWETGGHPTLFASWLKAGPDSPTLLIYNHYDVQPVDPLNEWDSPPFEPTIRGEEIYARGASDDKGQCFYVIEALKEMLERDGKLPINIKLCIEGEEEIGSPGLARILNERSEQLKADYLAIVDVSILGPGRPSVCLGIRGIVTMDLELVGSSTDLHSGAHGGVVYNPLHAMVEMLAKLRDKDGRVTIPGFYDEVKVPSPEERSKLYMEFDEAEFYRDYGATANGGEKEFSPLERKGMRPALEINGLSGGYSGAGFKTVIPAKASAKISCRLVPDQDPEVMGKRVADYLKKIAPKGIEVKVHLHPGTGRAVTTSPNSPLTAAFAKAFTQVYGKPCAYVYEGGSIPIATALGRAAGAEVVMVGVAYGTDKIHAPNEHFGVKRLDLGKDVIVNALENLSTVLNTGSPRRS